MSFTITEKVLILSLDEVNKFTLSVARQSNVVMKFFEFRHELSRDKDSCKIFYKEVESSALHLPIRNLSLFWLDVESGFLYKSVSAMPVYIPLFDLKGLIEYYSADWDDYLGFLQDTFTQNSGFDLETAAEELQKMQPLSFNPNLSFAANFFKLSSEKPSKYPLSMFSDTRIIVRAMNDETFLKNTDPKQLWALPQSFVPVRNYGLTLLENSFQSPVLKSFMGSLLSEVPDSIKEERIIKKAESAGLFQYWFRYSKAQLTKSSLNSFFKETDSPSNLSTTTDPVPVEIVLNQLAKIVRRFKLKGVV